MYTGGLSVEGIRARRGANIGINVRAPAIPSVKFAVCESAPAGM